MAFLLTLLSLLSVSPTSAYMYFSEEPGSCQIIGDSDLYGLGVRMGFYLQWLSLLISRIANLPSSSSIMASQLVIMFAIFINAVAGYRLPGALVGYEAIFLLLESAVIITGPTIGFFDLIKDRTQERRRNHVLCLWFFKAGRNSEEHGLPSGDENGARQSQDPHLNEDPPPEEGQAHPQGGNRKNNGQLDFTRYTYLVFLISATSAMLFASRRPSSVPVDKADCSVWVMGRGLIPIKDLYNSIGTGSLIISGQTYQRLFFALGILYLGLAVFLVLLLLWQAAKQLRAEDEQNEARPLTPEPPMMDILLSWPEIAGLVVSGPIFIGLLEWQIRSSGVDVSVDLTRSSGQLIPFVAGILGLALTLWSILVKCSTKARAWSRGRRRHIEEGGNIID